MDEDSLYIDTPTLQSSRSIVRETMIDNPRRAAVATALAAAHRTVATAVDYARRLDELFFRDYHDVRVEEPIFIVAAPRSGTTFLQRLLALDGRFFHLKLFHTIFPAVSLFRLFEVLGRVDEWTGGVLRAGLDAFETIAFGGWEGIHRVSFRQPEEDEGFFVLTLLSPGIYLLFPEIDRLRRPAALDDLDEATRRRVMDFYEGSLTRVKHHEGPDRQYLGKTVLAPGRLESLLDRFPGARFIHLVRHPYETVPSFVSMFRRPWYAHSPEIPDQSPSTRRLAELVVDYYRRLLDVGSQLESHQWLDVRFDVLVSEPRSTIEKVYDWLGIELTEDFESELRRELRSERGGGDHDYSLRQFGLSRKWIYDRLSGVFEAYGFERQPGF